MASAVLFIGWNRPLAGKESEAMRFVMGEGTEALARFEKQGYFERSERVFLTPHCGTTNGMMLLFGERAKLDELRRTDEFEKLSMKLSVLHTRYGVIPGVTGEGVRRFQDRNPDLVRR